MLHFRAESAAVAMTAPVVGDAARATAPCHPPWLFQGWYCASSSADSAAAVEWDALVFGQVLVWSLVVALAVLVPLFSLACRQDGASTGRDLRGTVRDQHRPRSPPAATWPAGRWRWCAAEHSCQ